MPGLDLQGGREDGSGRGFVFLPPTVRPSKVDGERRGYRFEVAPGKPGRRNDALAELVGRTVAERAARNAASNGSGAISSDDLRQACLSAESGTQRPVLLLYARRLAKRGLSDDEIMPVLRDLVGQMPVYDPHKPWTDKSLRGLLDKPGTVIPDEAGPFPTRAEMKAHFAEQRAARRGYEPLESVARLQELMTRWIIGDDWTEPPGILGQVLSRSELAGLPKPEPLIDEWLDLREVVTMSGDTGTYKTFIVLGMGCSIATGKPWLGGRKVRGGPFPVLFVIGEGGGGLDDRITAWEQEHGVTVPDAMLTVSLRPESINSPKFWEAVTEEAIEKGAKFVALDTYSSLAPDADEVKDSAKVIRWMTDLAVAIGGTVVLLHHTGWVFKDRSRGGSQLEANPDSVIITEKPKDAEWSDPRSIWRKKAKETEDGAKLWLALKPVGPSCVLELTEEPERPSGKKQVSHDDIREAIAEYVSEHEPKTTREKNIQAVASRLEIGDKRVRAAFDELADEGLIEEKPGKVKEGNRMVTRGVWSPSDGKRRPEK